MTRIAVTLLAAGLALSAPRAVVAQTPASATIADLGFMAGCWRGEFANGGLLEEVYAAPSSNLMLGLSRFLRGDRAIQFEFTRITADSTGIALLPFPGGRPSEHAFRLTALEPGRATFEAPEHDFPKRIRYTRETDGSLTARIDGGTDESRAQEWRMQPVPCRPAGALAVVEAQFQAFNRHDAAALAAGVAPDFVWLSVSGDSVAVEVRGRAEFERGMAAYFAEFPDVRSAMENAVVNGRFVAFRERVRWTGKNGERSQSSLAVYEVEDGLIRRVWYYPAVRDR